MTRQLKLPLALVMALAVSQAQALGLGQLQVKSGLGQPLVAEIPILSATPAELENLNVRLASPDAFARVGLDRPLDLTANLQMQVVKDARGQPVIRVSTPGRFNEPFLSFLVEADWGRGTLVREFTALVDPPYIAPAIIRPLLAPTVAAAPAPVAPTLAIRPILSEPAQNPATVVRQDKPIAVPMPISASEPAPAAVVAQPPIPVFVAPEPVPASPATEPAFEPSPFSQPLPDFVEESAPAPVIAQEPPTPLPPPPVAATAPAPAPEPAPEQAPPSDQYGPVKAGQTLWSVAESLRPDTAVTVNQMMLALQRANPGAFIDDNVNRLKSGAVLRIPAREEAAAILPEEAASLIRQQSGMRPIPQPEQSLASQSAPAPETTPTAPVPVARPVTKAIATAPAKPRQARLEIVPPAGKSGARSTQSGASASGGGTELRAELSQAKEDLAARQAEVVELKSRVADLEKLQTDSKTLIEMQSSELKALRDRLAEIEQQQQAVVATLPAPAPAPVVQAEPSAAKAAQAVSDSAEVDPQTTGGDWYTHPGTIGGALLLLALMAWWLSRRGKQVAEPTATTRRVSDDAALHASLAKNSTAEPVPGQNESEVEEDFEALGLQDMVYAHPKDMEARLNLLRHLHRKGDSAAFEIAATDMRGQIANTTDPRWREVVVMGMGMLPGHPLFSQLGWNTPKFAGSSEPEAKPAPAPAPEPESTPSWMRTTGPSQIPGLLAEPMVKQVAETSDPEPEVVDEIDPGSFGNVAGVPDDIHRQEAELQADDEGSATKIELAKAYLDIGDLEGARAMLEDVVADGGPSARAMAAKLLKELG